jgi:hypothetical protein
MLWLVVISEDCSVILRPFDLRYSDVRLYSIAEVDASSVVQVIFAELILISETLISLIFGAVVSEEFTVGCDTYELGLDGVEDAGGVAVEGGVDEDGGVDGGGVVVVPVNVTVDPEVVGETWLVLPLLAIQSVLGVQTST